MTTSINVDKRSVKQLLETGKNKRFIIPEYQRPYAWSDEQIQVLFDDLTEYTLNTTEDENNTYFLGTIVSYENDNKEQEKCPQTNQYFCIVDSPGRSMVVRTVIDEIQRIVSVISAQIVCQKGKN